MKTIPPNTDPNEIWVVEMPDGTIDGFCVRSDRGGKEITHEDAIKILFPLKRDLLELATSGARLRLGTRSELLP